MRWVIGFLITLALAPRAFAGDLDVLGLGAPPAAPWIDGQPVGSNWMGFYLGGQFSYSNAGADFSQSTQAPIAYALRQTTLESQFSPSTWPVLGSASHSTPGFEGFLGYNAQFEHLVFGVEGTYDQASLSLVAPNSPISRVTPADSAGFSYLVNITGSGTVSSLDFGTLRGRAGWTIGNFLPYGFAGFALGHGNLNVAATVSGQQCNSSVPPLCTPFSFAGTNGKNGEWFYGFTVGGGLDVAITPNFFLRAEYEFTQFAPVSTVQVSINTGRVGAGFKF